MTPTITTAIMPEVRKTTSTTTTTTATGKVMSIKDFATTKTAIDKQRAVTDIPTTLSPMSTSTEVTSTSTTTTENLSTTMVIATDRISKDTPPVGHTDDPIIIPTIMYVNDSDAAKIDNNLVPVVPKPNGELIIQKLAMTKPLFKKEDIKKKPLPRRKGTLKATYGEKLFEKSKGLIISLPTTSKISKLAKDKVNVSKPIVEEMVTESKFLVTHNTDNRSNDIKAVNDTKIVNALKDKIQKVDHPEINQKTKEHLETSPIPHAITAITNNNIKTIHYRTKKPKALTQIKKPRIDQNHTNEIDKKNETENHDIKIINKTKVKNINTEKRTVKTLKSINKEIHKVPSTPISETSKSLSDAVKSDIAPENKGGFEILDKNNLWELLKEGPDDDPSKTDDKLQVHNRINVLAQKLSNVTNENRSL